MRKVFSLVLVLSLLSGGIVLAGQTKVTPKDAKDISIVIMPKLVGIPYFQETKVGAERAGKDLGVKVIFAGPTNADAAEQVKMMEDFISQGVDAIAVSPNDSSSMGPVCRRGRTNGILMLDWDSTVDNQDDIDYSIRQVDDEAFAAKIWDLLVEDMGDSGEYAVLTGSIEAAALNTWIDMGIKYAEKKYPNLKLVSERIPTDEQQQIAYQKTLELVNTYPNLKGIIALSSPAPGGAGQALQERGRQDITVIGSSIPSGSAKDLFSDGSIDAVVQYSPADLGYLTIYVTAQILMGKPLSDGMEVPTVGSIRLLKDGKTVIMVSQFTEVTKNNYHQLD